MHFAWKLVEEYNSLLKTVSLQFELKCSCFTNEKDVLLKNAFSIKSAERIQLAVENCVSLQFQLKLCFFPNEKDILVKNAFCINSAQRIQLAFKNCVGLHFGLKTTFCRIISMSSYKMRFTWNLLKEYNSLLKTVFHFSLS